MAVPRRCHQCHTPLNGRAGVAVTLDSDGAYRLWTRDRAAYLAHFNQQVHLAYLCPACAALEPTEAATDKGKE